MQFDVLGPLRVVANDGSPVDTSRRVQRRLLSLLILHAGRSGLEAQRVSELRLPPPRFADPDRVSKLRGAFPARHDGPFDVFTLR